MNIREFKTLIDGLCDETEIVVLTGSGSGMFAKPLEAEIERCSMHNGHIRTEDALSKGPIFKVVAIKSKS